MSLYVALTGHGFGHAARALSQLQATAELRPETSFHLVAATPDWFIKSYFTHSCVSRRRSLDAGLIQKDSLNIDHPASLRELRRLEENRAALVQEEAAYIRDRGIKLVFADIPAPAADIARAAGVPCWMAGNFGWDFIYRDLGGEYLKHAESAARSYAACDLLLRLPFAEPMTGFPRRLDVGVTGAPSARDPEEIRAALRLPDRPVIAVAFGGLGLGRVPYGNINSFNGRKFPGKHFVIFDQSLPDLPGASIVRDRSLRVKDLLPLCEAALTKPGYGTFSEAYQAERGMYCVDREGFAETPVLRRALRDYFPHRLIGPEEFFEGDWSFLNEPLEPPRRGAILSRDGDDFIARKIAGFLEGLLDARGEPLKNRIAKDE